MIFKKKKLLFVIVVLGIAFSMQIKPIISNPAMFFDANIVAEVYIDSNEDLQLNYAFNEFSKYINHVGGEIRSPSWTDLKNVENQLILIAHGSPDGIQLQDEIISWNDFDNEISSWKASKIIVLACYSAYSADSRVRGAEGVIDAGIASIAVANSILPLETQSKYRCYYIDSLEIQIERALSSGFLPLATESGYTFAAKLTKTRTGFWPFYIYERSFWINMQSIPLTVAAAQGVVNCILLALGQFAVAAMLSAAVTIFYASLAMNAYLRPLHDIKFGFIANTILQLDYMLDMGDYTIRVPFAPGYWAMVCYQYFNADNNPEVPWNTWINVPMVP